jgi:branched-chain amino acid transport system substrate-binding protein
MKRLSIFLFVAVLALFPKSGLAQPPLKVGALIPFSGRWGDSGREYAKGVLDAAKWTNQRGGVYGRKLEIIVIDDDSQAGETMAAFRKLNEADRVLLLGIYSMETALALAPHVHYHRIPAIVNSLPASLANPAKYPFIFTAAPTPKDIAKIAMSFISESPGVKSKKPKVVFLGSQDHLSRDSLDEVKKYGKDRGLDTGIDIFSLDSAMAKGVSFVLTTLASYNPDFIYLSVTSKEAFSILQEAGQMGLKAKWICSAKTFDENLTPFEGVMGVQPVSPFGEDVPGMAEIKDAHQRWHPYDSHTLSYVEGWAMVQIIAEALGRSLPEQKLSRESVKSSLEGFKNFVLGGLIPPVTLTANDHRASVESRVFTVKDGKLLRQTGFISLKR